MILTPLALLERLIELREDVQRKDAEHVALLSPSPTRESAARELIAYQNWERAATFYHEEIVIAFPELESALRSALSERDELRKALEQVTERSTIRTVSTVMGDVEEISVSLRYCLATEKPDLANYLRARSLPKEGGGS